MRAAFIRALVETAAKNDRVTLIVGDLGYNIVEPFRERFPNRFVNAGIAEQNMTGIAAGMALCGKVVFTYSIANFPTLRSIEQIRNDVCYHRANVKIISVGGGLGYGALGASHHATEDIAMMRALPEMTVIAPGDPIEAEFATRAIVGLDGPAYLRLGKSGEPKVHNTGARLEVGKAVEVLEGSDVTLIATGTMLYSAMKVAEKLAAERIYARVISMHTIKPLDVEQVVAAANETGAVVTIEEHSITGGLGSAVAEVLAEFSGARVPFKRLGIPPVFTCFAGSHDYLKETYSLSIEGLFSTILAFLSSECRSRAQTISA